MHMARSIFIVQAFFPPKLYKTLDVYFLMVTLCQSMSSIPQRHTFLLVVYGCISCQQLVEFLGTHFSTTLPGVSTTIVLSSITE